MGTQPVTIETVIKDRDDALEAARAASERSLSLNLDNESLRESIVKTKLKYKLRLDRHAQAMTSLRWWAVFDLCWMLREVLEPAKNAWLYSGSWAYKLSALNGYTGVMIAWFAIAALLMLPLIITLATAPKTNAARRAEQPAVIGLFMGALGFTALSVAAARLDIPHVVLSYRESTVMLIVTGLLVSCWHNTRVVRAKREAEAQASVAAELGTA